MSRRLHSGPGMTRALSTPFAPLVSGAAPALALTVVWFALLSILGGCGSVPVSGGGPQVGAGKTASNSPGALQEVPEAAREVVLTALGLLETGYKFGGKNPEAGLDCSGMVNYVFANALSRRLGASAAEMAQRGRVLAGSEWRAGDLVFFNTRGAPYSHVGIYLGEARFIHAPSSKGKVRIDRLDSGWFAARVTEVRRYID